MLSRCCNLTTLPLPYPLSFASLDTHGNGIAESSWLTRYFQNQFAGADDTVQVMQPSSRRSLMKILSFALFRSSWSVVEPSWGRSGTFVAFGVLLLFWFRSRTLIVSGWCNVLFMYLCEVAIVSQLCISFPYVLHGLCEDYLTCDIAFNAVMPLSRASTRGRYSRIEGVTSW